MYRSITSALLCAVLGLGPAPTLAAQSQPEASGSEPDEVVIPFDAESTDPESGFASERTDGPRAEGRQWWAGLRGERTPDRIYGGLWTLHLKRTEDGLSQHHLLALGWRGMYFGTFVNSHDNRTWAVALSRSAVVMEGRDAGFSLGYRVGLMAGYDEQLASVAGRWPAIPAGELVGTVRYRRVGIQGTFAGIVSSFGMFVAL